MKNKKILRNCSILSFFTAISSLIVVDWYFHGFGLLIMFVFISLGLTFEQFSRIYFPSTPVSDYTSYKKYKLIKLWALILFVMSPMALIYGNKIFNKLGFFAFFLLLGIGIALEQIAQMHHPYSSSKNKIFRKEN